MRQPLVTQSSIYVTQNSRQGWYCLITEYKRPPGLCNPIFSPAPQVIDPSRKFARREEDPRIQCSLVPLAAERSFHNSSASDRLT